MDFVYAAEVVVDDMIESLLKCFSQVGEVPDSFEKTVNEVFLNVRMELDECGDEDALARVSSSFEALFDTLAGNVRDQFERAETEVAEALASSETVIVGVLDMLEERVSEMDATCDGSGGSCLKCAHVRAVWIGIEGKRQALAATSPDDAVGEARAKFERSVRRARRRFGRMCRRQAHKGHVRGTCVEEQTFMTLNMRIGGPDLR